MFLIFQSSLFVVVIIQVRIEKHNNNWLEQWLEGKDNKGKLFSKIKRFILSKKFVLSDKRLFPYSWTAEASAGNIMLMANDIM